MLWRQGDVFIQSIRSLPKKATRRPRAVLAEGEITGHSHRVEDEKTARLYGDDRSLYLQVLADSATVVHEEHAPVTLPRGVYRVWRQREYTPRAIRTVRD